MKMITGDHLLIAKETCRRLGMGDNILSAEGLPKLDPETQEKPSNLAGTHGELILNADGFAQVIQNDALYIFMCVVYLRDGIFHGDN